MKKLVIGLMRTGKTYFYVRNILNEYQGRVVWISRFKEDVEYLGFEKSFREVTPKSLSSGSGFNKIHVSIEMDSSESDIVDFMCFLREIKDLEDTLLVIDDLIGCTGLFSAEIIKYWLNSKASIFLTGQSLRDYPEVGNEYFSKWEMIEAKKTDF